MHGVQTEGTKLLHGGCKNTDNFLYRIYYTYIRLIKLNRFIKVKRANFIK